MKKLILIQNDYPGTGKSTLALCFHRYLQQYGVEHQRLSLTEEDSQTPDGITNLDASSLTPRTLLDHIDASPLTILDVSTGLGEFFNKFYQGCEMDMTLQAAGVAVSVVLPVTADRESFDSVTDAAEVFSDNAEYLIAHLVTSCYDEDDKVWDTSYAARVMDMFEAVELHIPEINFQAELSTEHMSLDTALQIEDAEERLGKEFTKWQRRVMGQVDSARQYLFGDAFRPTMAPKPAKAVKKAKTKLAA
ncbi:hypothetical protein [Prosthecobacter sp.]|uniref:hypothetical protein n=1 Tax=Prosthecobacter sp. TaxID=1965333 RepID=UPI0037835FCA